MNIADKFNEKKKKIQQEEEIKRKQRVDNLAKEIISSLRDKEVVESIENYLVENGSVSIKDFGCLCQDGFCKWQEGLDVLLQPLYQEWSEKGVIIRPSLRLDIYVNGGLSYYRKEMTLEELRKWYQTKK